MFADFFPSVSHSIKDRVDVLLVISVGGSTHSLPDYAVPVGRAAWRKNTGQLLAPSFCRYSIPHKVLLRSYIALEFVSDNHSASMLDAD